MYGMYMQEICDVVSAGEVVAESFLVWHRSREFVAETGAYRLRGYAPSQRRSPTLVVACRYWYELTDGFWGQFVLTQIPHFAPTAILPKAEDRYLEGVEFPRGVQYLWIRYDRHGNLCSTSEPIRNAA